MKSARYKIINPRKRRLVQAGDFLMNAGRMLGLLSVESNSQPLPTLRDCIKRILVIRLAFIGDIVMTQPALAPLRSAFPDAEIDVLTSHSAAPLIQTDPSVDQVISFDAPWFYDKEPGSAIKEMVNTIKGQYDLGIDFRGDIRNIWHCLYKPGIPYCLSYTSGGGGALLTHPVQWTKWKHKVEFHLDILRKAGFDAPYSDPKIYLTQEEIKSAGGLLHDLTGQDGRAPIVIHPGSRLPLKRWPTEKFIELIRKIHEVDSRPVILVEAPGNESMTADITDQVSVTADLAGKLTIREMAALFHHTDVLICHDSAPMHIAAAVGCRVVAMFGPSRSMETAPCGSGHKVIEVACPLKDRCDESSCWHEDGVGCMQGIPVEDVLSRLR